MKRLLWGFSILFSLFVSCSNSENPKNSDLSKGPDQDTLKKQISVKSESITWSRELEKRILTESLYHNQNIAEDVVISPKVLSAASTLNASGTTEKIYPELKNFGSLENESIKKSTINLVKDFLSSFMNKEKRLDAASYMTSDALFSFVFFMDDLKTYGNFTNNGEDDDDIKISRYVMGKSFLSGKEVQIPVRLYLGANKHNYKYVDVSLFADETYDKIKQIKIEAWGK